MSTWASWLPSLKGFDKENVSEGRKRKIMQPTYMQCFERNIDAINFFLKTLLREERIHKWTSDTERVRSVKKGN